MGFLVLGLVIGLIIAGIVYWKLQQTIARQQRELRQSQRTIEEMNQSHETRMQEAIKALQADYQRQLARRTEELSQQYSAGAKTTEAITPPGQLEEISPAEIAVEMPTVAEEPVPPVTPAIPESAPEAASESVAIPSSQTPLRLTVQPGSSTQHIGISRLTASVQHPDPIVRKEAAASLGQLTAGRSISGPTQSAVTALEKLVRDPNPNVRQTAIAALGQVRSDRVIPILERALRDSHAGVVKAASEAIARFRVYPVRRPAARPKPLPKNRDARG